MINDASLRAVAEAQWTPHFITPLYESYCFSRIPQLVRHLLAGADDMGLPADTLGPHLPSSYDRVILFFVDAFGWRFFERCYETYPFLQRIVRDGVASKLTSQFPSTTAAHVTAIHAGVPVGQSGVHEWFYYEPLVDRIIAPLLFAFAGDKERNTLAAHIRPEDIYPRTTLYQELGAQGVQSVVLQHQEYTPSPYTEVVTRGARVVPYGTLPEALVTLRELLLADSGRGYYVLYFDKIDAIGHRYGPNSLQLAAEIDAFLTAMERIFYQGLAGKLDRTLFLLTADHGQVEIDPATTIYLNVAAPHITTYTRTNRAGHLLAPAGSPRDMFLYIQPEYLDEAHAYLQDQLAGRAEVYRVRDLIEQHLFGAVGPALRERIGDLVILPYKHESVWWYEQDRFEQHYYGHHGGLTREEMETLLLAQPYA